MTRSETRFAPNGARSIARATIVNLTIAVALLSSLGASNALAAEPKLLMLPIVVHSAEDPEYLRAGLSDMLAARFERLGAIELLRGDTDVLVEAAHSEVLDYVKSNARVADLQVTGGSVDDLVRAASAQAVALADAAPQPEQPGSGCAAARAERYRQLLEYSKLHEECLLQGDTPEQCEATIGAPRKRALDPATASAHSDC